MSELALPGEYIFLAISLYVPWFLVEAEGDRRPKDKTYEPSLSSLHHSLEIGRKAEKARAELR